MGQNGPRKSLKRALRVGLIAFVSAVAIAFFSQRAMAGWPAFLALAVLLIIVAVGILFDMIGTAVTAASETPFHARASKKLPGAKQSLWLLRNADLVANFSNDIVGDISGTVSGAAAATVAVSLSRLAPAWAAGSETLWSLLAVGFVAGLTVGGKAAAKTVAIQQAEQIILWAGELLAWLERTFWVGRKPSGVKANAQRGKRG